MSTGVTVLRRLTAGASDQQLERRFGTAIVQRVLFWRMAAGFDPAAADGFQGRIAYELTRPATGRAPTHWTLDVHDGRARARPGSDHDAAVTMRMTLADFIRIASGRIDPAAPLLTNRASFDGDFALAARLPEMFGAPRPGR